MKPGRKKEFIRSLLAHCYFEYTLRVPPIPGLKGAKERLLTVVDLEPLNLPDGYPETIEDVFADLYAPEEKRRFLIVPAFENIELKIAPEVRT